MAKSSVFVETKAPTENYGFLYLLWTKTIVDNVAMFSNVQYILYSCKQFYILVKSNSSWQYTYLY